MTQVPSRAGTARFDGVAGKMAARRLWAVLIRQDGGHHCIRVIKSLVAHSDEWNAQAVEPRPDGRFMQLAIWVKDLRKIVQGYATAKWRSQFPFFLSFAAVRGIRCI